MLAATRKRKLDTYYETQAQSTNLQDFLDYGKVEKFLLIALSVTAVVIFWNRNKLT